MSVSQRTAPYLAVLSQALSRKIKSPLFYCMAGSAEGNRGEWWWLGGGGVGEPGGWGVEGVAAVGAICRGQLSHFISISTCLGVRVVAEFPEQQLLQRLQ